MKKITASQQRALENATLIAALQLVFSSLEKAHFPLYKLEEIADTTSGGTPDRRRSEYYEGDIPWIKSGELKDGIIQNCEEYITEEGLQNSSAKIYPKDTVVVALYGATVGKTGILAFEAASNQAVCAIFPKRNDISKEFIFWYLRHKRPDFLQSSFGAAQPNISQRVLRSTTLPIPPIELQKIICSYFKIIELRQERRKEGDLPLLPEPLSHINTTIARIEEMAAKIEKARGLRQSIKEERSVLTKGILRQIFYSLDDYVEISLESVCEAVIDNLHSNPVYADRGVACVRSPDVGWGKLHLHSALKTTEEEYINRTVRGEPKADDIVFVREGGGTGKVAIVEEGQRFSLGQRVMMFRLNKEKVVPKFFLYQMLSPLIYEEQIVPQCKGSASPHINIGVLKNFTFILPPLDKQQNLIKKIEELYLKTEILEDKQREVDIELNALLPSILDKAFKGEL